MTCSSAGVAGCAAWSSVSLKSAGTRWSRRRGRGTRRRRLEGLLDEQLERRVERLEDVLAEDRLAELDGVLQGAQVVALRQLDDEKARLRLHVPHPLVRLPLRVDHERPAARDRRDDPVVDREGVGGEALQVPRADEHGVADDLLQVERAAHWQPLLGAQGLPAGDRLLAERDRERAEVRDHARREQHVAEQVVVLGAERGRDLAPACARRRPAMGFSASTLCSPRPASTSPSSPRALELACIVASSRTP